MARSRGFRVQFTAIGRRLRTLPTAAAIVQVDRYASSFADDIIAEAQYPPPSVPEGSTYVRTGTLGDSWRKRRLLSGGTLGYEVRNEARDSRGRPYARLVHGPTGQWSVHSAHGWRTVTEIVDDVGGRSRFRRGVQSILTTVLT